MQTFGEQLVAARHAAHMTQEQLAKAANVARNTVSSWERNRTQPDMDMVQRLSQALQYSFAVAAPVESPAPEETPQEAAPEAVEPADIVNFCGGVTKNTSGGGLRRARRLSRCVLPRSLCRS